MKKWILIASISLIYTQCIDPNRKIRSNKNSVVGTVSITALLDFHLHKDTVQVEVDTLGYFFILNPPQNREKLRSAVKTAEIFMLYPNGKLLSNINFCTAKSSNEGLKIVFQGSPNPLFNEIMTLVFVDSFALATHSIPFYEDGEIFYDCHLRTDSLHVKLNKYPVSKGDIIRGYLAYKGWKDCTIREDKNRMVGEPLSYEGFFECKVE
jgi:hypothetical protein